MKRAMEVHEVASEVGNGELFLEFPMLGRRFMFGTVYGGPYERKPGYMYGVKLAQEIDAPADVVLDIADFGVPSQKALKRALMETFNLMIFGNKSVYVGCMGGFGRTGLFLAAMAKVCGWYDPVEYVRSMYVPNAVETDEQLALIKNLRVGKLRFFIRLMLLVRALKFISPLTLRRR